MHWPADDGSSIEEYWGALLELKQEGKARAVGLSNHNVAQLEEAEVVGHVDSLQPPFSAVKRGTAPELAWCADHGTGVIIYSPMQAGLLTGAFSAERVANLHEDDWRKRDPQFQGENLEHNLALADRLSQMGEKHDVGPGAVAIAWALTWPGVTAAIVGGRSPSQVDGWLPAATLELTQAELDEVSEAIESTQAGFGPSRPPR